MRLFTAPVLGRRLCHPRLSRAFTTRNPLPATFIRGGTSKGVFLNRSDLPPNPKDWAPILGGIMGSPDPYGRQLNGMGGGVSSLSKICVVGPPLPQKQSPTATDSVDLEYTFVQVGITDGALDFSGNCGNLTTAVGIFALDENMVRIPSLEMYSGAANTNRRKATIKLRNSNTGKTIRVSFPVSMETGLATLSDPEIEIAGVPGKASRVLCEFLNPAGARTGALLPTGNVKDEITLKDGKKVVVSCVDASNPTVFIAADQAFSEPDAFHLSIWPHNVFPRLEEIRQSAAVLMGLDPKAQAQPKICIVAKGGEDSDIAAKALSMGVLHKAIPGTVALCLSAAAGVEGSVVDDMADTDCGGGGTRDIAIRVEIQGGTVNVKARFHGHELYSVAIERTARRLMHGEVFW